MSNKEKQIHLYHELQEYEKETDMTAKEKLELYKWVKQGNSVYSNPGLVTDEDGRQMDFIEGYRIEMMIEEEIRSLSSEQLEQYHRQQEACMSDLLSTMTARYPA